MYTQSPEPKMSLRERMLNRIVNWLLNPKTVSRLQAWEKKHPEAAQAFAAGVLDGTAGRNRR